MSITKKSKTPETDSAQLREYHSNPEAPRVVYADFARMLERERDEARKFAEEYRRVWEMVSDAIDETPNHDPLPWVSQKEDE